MPDTPQARDPMLGPCARCGRLQVDHPGGYCPDTLDASGMVEPGAPMFEPRADTPEARLCPCGHASDFCHIKNAEKWCGAGVTGEHYCYVTGDQDDGETGHYRPCPASLCEARHLFEIVLGLRDELRERQACLEAARDDLARIIGAGVEDGGLWIRAVAGARLL